MANYLVIAGTSTIGSQIAKNLLSAGHQVIITGREKQKTETAAHELGVGYTLCDAAKFDSVNTAFEFAISKLGSLYGVVNCAGSLILKPAHLTTQVEFEQTIATNLTSAFAVTAAAGKYLSSSGGSVVLISSAAALIGLANHEAITCAKSAIIGLARSAAASYASHNLRFNVVAPGLTETNLSKNLTQNSFNRKISESMHPLGRLGKPNDIAEAICFFLEPSHDWITGQVLAVDGGLSSLQPRVTK